MCLWVTYKKKNVGKNIFFAFLKSELEFDPDSDPDPLISGTDPRIRIRIRTKMSRIPNTAVFFQKLSFQESRKTHRALRALCLCIIPRKKSSFVLAFLSSLIFFLTPRRHVTMPS
jgi:hypothetical protein